MQLVTLLTDFGSADGYVGALKGVLYDLAPAAVLVDLAHDLPPGDVRAAAFIWASTVGTFPAGTIHLAVVDPGVGTARRAVAWATGRATFVAPDNGLGTGLFGDLLVETVSLSAEEHRRHPTAPTFHGRDLFAPAAGHLAAGGRLAELGPPLDPATLVRLPGYHAQRDEEAAVGQVIVVDRFGNLRTNIPGAWLRANSVVELGAGSVAGVHETYADVRVGEPCAYVGSAGTLEVAVRDGSAAGRLGATGGTPVRVTNLQSRTAGDGGARAGT